jgi:hypothetical protein
MSKSKKSYYKKKFKGVRYINKALKKYGGKKYLDADLRKEKAREIYDYLKSTNQKVILENIFNYQKKPKQSTGKQGQAPQLPKNLSKISYYFELIEYPAWILGASNEIYFTSSVSPEDKPAIQGGVKIDYTDYFQDFVGYCNDLKSFTDPEEDYYTSDWLVTCTDPVFNPATKRWESKIITVTGTGEPFDYGFNPKQPKTTPKTLTLSSLAPKPSQTSKKPAKTPPAQPPGPVKKAETKLDYLTAKELTKQLELLKQDFKDGIYTKEEYKVERQKLLDKYNQGGII